MTLVKCRDCGLEGNEDPDDPAPNLCPDCYEKRLASITPRFESLDPHSFMLWFEQTLIEVAGETPEFARKHAGQLVREAMRFEASNGA
jgi:hypothetical protein